MTTMPRPKEYEVGRVQTQLRLESSLRDRLQVEAGRRDLSMNFLVERALEKVLPIWEAQDLDHLDIGVLVSASHINGVKPRKSVSKQR